MLSAHFHLRFKIKLTSETSRLVSNRKFTNKVYYVLIIIVRGAHHAPRQGRLKEDQEKGVVLTTIRKAFPARLVPGTSKFCLIKGGGGVGGGEIRRGKGPPALKEDCRSEAEWS